MTGTNVGNRREFGQMCKECDNLTPQGGCALVAVTLEIRRERKEKGECGDGKNVSADGKLWARRRINFGNNIWGWSWKQR